MVHLAGAAAARLAKEELLHELELGTPRVTYNSRDELVESLLSLLQRVDEYARVHVGE